jgi:hypothetical protein
VADQVGTLNLASPTEGRFVTGKELTREFPCLALITALRKFLVEYSYFVLGNPRYKEIKSELKQ